MMIRLPITVTHVSAKGFAFAVTDDQKQVFIPHSVATHVSPQPQRRYIAKVIENMQPEKADYFAVFIDNSGDVIEQPPVNMICDEVAAILNGGGIYTLPLLIREVGKRLGIKIGTDDSHAILSWLEVQHEDGKLCEVHVFGASDDEEAAVTAYVASVDSFLAAI